VYVRVTHPRRGGVERTSSQPGTVQAFETVELYAGVSGYLKTLAVDIGDRVKHGQPLARVDVPELAKQVQRNEAAVEQAEARVKQMKARTASAKADLEAARAGVVQAQAVAKSKAAELRFREQQLRRMQDLFASKSIDVRLVDEKTEQRDAALETERAAKSAVLTASAGVAAAVAKVEQAEADRQEAESEVKVARADLEKSQVLVGFATITAPFDGVVTVRNFFPGDFVRAATESGDRKPLLVVQRTDLFRVVVQVPDRDVPYTDVGDLAEVEIDALPGRKLPAKVSRMAQSEDPATRLMHVEVDLPNPTVKIRHGMYGRVTLRLDRSDALAVPSGCLVGKDRDGTAKVFVVRDGVARLAAVRVGADNGLEVAVLDGLTADDDVILHPGGDVEDGTAVAASPAPAAR